MLGYFLGPILCYLKTILPQKFFITALALWQFWTNKLLYSGKFFMGTNILPNALDEIFMVFVFILARMQKLTTSIRVMPLCSSHVEKHQPSSNSPLAWHLFHQEQQPSYPCRHGSHSQQNDKDLLHLHFVVMWGGSIVSHAEELIKRKQRTGAGLWSWNNDRGLPVYSSSHIQTFTVFILEAWQLCPDQVGHKSKT